MPSHRQAQRGDWSGPRDRWAGSELSAAGGGRTCSADNRRRRSRLHHQLASWDWRSRMQCPPGQRMKPGTVRRRTWPPRKTGQSQLWMVLQLVAQRPGAAAVVTMSGRPAGRRTIGLSTPQVIGDWAPRALRSSTDRCRRSDRRARSRSFFHSDHKSRPGSSEGNAVAETSETQQAAEADAGERARHRRPTSRRRSRRDAVTSIGAGGPIVPAGPGRTTVGARVRSVASVPSASPARGPCTIGCGVGADARQAAVLHAGSARLRIGRRASPIKATLHKKRRAPARPRRSMRSSAKAIVRRPVALMTRTVDRAGSISVPPCALARSWP